MKTLLIVTSVLLGRFANAQFAKNASLEDAFKAVPVCAGPVTTDATRVARLAAEGQLAVTGTSDFQAFDLAVGSNVVDVKILGNVLYVLYPTKIQEWDLTTRALVSETTTIQKSRGQGLREGALAMDWHGDQLVIAHGRLGYAIYDTKSHSITTTKVVLQDQAPLESAVVDVKVLGDRAIFVVDRYTLVRGSQKMPFHGFLVVDLTSQNEIHRSLGGDIGAKMLEIVGETVMVGFDGPIQSFRFAEVTGRGDVQLRRSVSKYAMPGHPFGQPSIVGDKLFSCFVQSSAPGSTKKSVPIVLDLSTFKL